MIVRELHLLPDCLEVTIEAGECLLNLEEHHLGSIFLRLEVPIVILELGTDKSRTGEFVLQQLDAFLLGLAVEEVHGTVVMDELDEDYIRILGGYDLLPLLHPSREVAYCPIKIWQCSLLIGVQLVEGGGVAGGGACGLVLTANAIMFLTILGFFIAFDGDDVQYSVW